MTKNLTRELVAALRACDPNDVERVTQLLGTAADCIEDYAQRAAHEPKAPHRDTVRLDWLIQDYRTIDLYNALDANISMAKDPVEVRLAIDAMIAKEAAHQNRTGD